MDNAKTSLTNTLFPHNPSPIGHLTKVSQKRSTILNIHICEMPIYFEKKKLKMSIYRCHILPLNLNKRYSMLLFSNACSICNVQYCMITRNIKFINLKFRVKMLKRKGKRKGGKIFFFKVGWQNTAIYARNTYYDVYQRWHGESPEPAQVGIGDVCTEDRSDPNGSGPVVNVSNWWNSVFMELGCQIHH